MARALHDPLGVDHEQPLIHRVQGGRQKCAGFLETLLRTANLGDVQNGSEGHDGGARRIAVASTAHEQFADLARGGRPLGAAGVAHGDMVYLLYDFVRQVEPAYRKTPLEARPFGEVD